VLGGDHSITYPILAAFEGPVAVIQIDAHPDLAEYTAGEEHHHGNFMSRALSLPQVTDVYQVGLRGTTVAPQGQIRGKVGMVLTPKGLRALGVEAFVAALPDASSYYVTFDIDSLDPIYAPGTSTPVPGGLTFEEAKDLLVAIGSSRRCVGFDLVEVNPQRDTNDHTAIAAIELLLAFLGAHFKRAGRRE
jgi:agmatinase